MNHLKFSAMNIEATAQVVLPTLSYEYTMPIEKDFGKVFLLPQKGTLIMELTREYVPMDDFRSIFSETIPIIEREKVKKFIFDKQNLRVFHQPSMEWYYVHWKKEIYEKGLATHRKILPKGQLAFNLAVEAGIAKIMAVHQDSVIPLLDIQYKATILEAIES